MIAARSFTIGAAVVTSLLTTVSPLVAQQMAASLAAPEREPASAEISALGSRLHVAASELAAIAEQGTIPSAWAQMLEEAHSAGLMVAANADVDEPRAPFVAGQFVGYLIWIERESRSRGNA